MTTRKAEWLELLDDADRDTTTTLDVVFKTIFSEVDDRLSGTEDGVADFRAVEGKLIETALTYLAERLEPEFDRVRAVADLGLLFEARSASSVTVGLGSKSFVVIDADKGRFSAPGYIGVFKTGDPSVFMAGTRASYDRASGLLTVNVDRIAGGGVTATDWQIVAVSGTDYLEAAALAEAARDLAAQYRTEAQNARDIALDHVGSANTHRMAAEDAQVAAEAAQGLAEDARDAAGVHLSGVQAIATHYLGPSASDPTTKPGGGALEEGDLYWNTAADEMRTWDGSAWGAAYVPGGSDVTSWNGRTGAVNPADADYSAGQIVVSPAVAGANRVQAALAALETAVGTKFPTASISAFMQTVLDDADAAAARTTLGAAATSHNHGWGDITSGVPGTISSLAGGTAAADKVWIYSGTAAGSFHTVTAFARSLLDDVDQAAALSTLGAAAAGHGHSNATGSAAGFMSASHYTKLEGIAANANNYVHPTGDGSLHVPANGTGNANKVLRATGTAGSYTWGFVAYSEITGVPAPLAAIDGLTPAADRLAYYTGASTAALTVFTALARSLCGDATQAEMLATMGAAAAGHSHSNATTSVSGFMSNTDKSKLDGIDAGAKASFSWAEITSKPAALDAIDGLTPAADRLAYYTGSGTGALATFPAFGRTLVANADAAAARADLELGALALQDEAFAQLMLALANTALSGNNVVNVTGLTDYREIVVGLRAVSLDFADSILIQFGDAGGYKISSYRGSATNGLKIYTAASAGATFDAVVRITGFPFSTVRSVGHWNVGDGTCGMGLYDSNAALDRFRISAGSANFDSGTMWVWGRR